MSDTQLIEDIDLEEWGLRSLGQVVGVFHAGAVRGSENFRIEVTYYPGAQGSGASYHAEVFRWQDGSVPWVPCVDGASQILADTFNAALRRALAWIKSGNP